MNVRVLLPTGEEIIKNVSTEPVVGRRRVPVATLEELRSEGMTCREIADEVGVAPATVANHLPPELCHLTAAELAVLREFEITPTEAVEYVEALREWRWAQSRQVLQRGRAAMKRSREAQAAVRKAVQQPLHLQQIVTSDGAELQEIIPGASGADDELIEDERQDELASILAGLDLEAVQGLDDHSLMRLRERLAEAGFHPNVRQSDRAAFQGGSA